MRAISSFKLFASFIFISFHLAAFAGSSFSDSTKRIDLSGSWEFQTAELKPAAPEAYLPNNPNISNVADWQTINVPNNWYLEGQNIHGKAWYRKNFVIKESTIGRYVRLNFQGVDYAADVWLNGQYLGHHEGYFQPFDFDVSKKIRKGGNNLMVLVDSPIEDPVNAWSLKKRLIKGIFSHHDTRPGGAWSARGQEKNTGGIWAPVYLDISDGLAIKLLEVVPKRSVNNWTVNSTLSLGSKLANNSEVIVEGVIEPVNFTGTKVPFKQIKSVSQGDSQLRLTTLVKQPKLWWPAGHGEPNLYKIKIKLTQAGRLLDYQEAVFGFREVHVDAKTQEWHINGRRMFIRGTNYISSQWLSEMTPGRYASDIDLMQRANINAVRVHAHIEADNFYQLCDQKGLLVFQDFPLQWGYSDDSVFIQEARKQVRDMVHVLNNHPSIVDWSLHNEPPWDASWMKYKYSDYDPNQNRTLDDLLFRDVTEIENSRFIRKQSATYEHAWMGWYFGDWQDFAKPTKEAWISEFGAQALPNYSSLRKIFNDDELWPDNDKEWEKWSYHNFQKHETFDIAKVPQGKNISEFIQNTQSYQTKLIKLAAESYRRQRYSPVTGVFQFMFVEDWPSINWGIVDYWRNTKPAYTALSEAYQPVLPSIEWSLESYAVGDSAVFGLWIINDLWHAYPRAEYQVNLFKDGELTTSKKYTIDIAEDSGKKIDDYKVVLSLDGAYSIQIKVLSNTGLLIAQNHHEFIVKPR
jgi:beta-mannosidase